MEITIIIPSRNEEANLLKLYQRLKEVLLKNKLNYQIIFINDSSTDNSIEILNKIKSEDESCQVINFEKNLGQTAAIAAGLKEAKYEIIAIIDADLQCDPADLTKLINKMDEGYDYIGGLRINRTDALMIRLASNFGNWLRNIVLKEKFHDSTTSLRILKKKTLKNIELKKAYHRFLPSLIKMQGYKVCEIPVKHSVRQHGQSKYNLLNRFWPSLKALIQVRKLKKSFK